MGFVSSTRITADDVLPTRHGYKLTLTFDANTWEQPADPELAEHMTSVFNDWRDGRCPFDAEMVYEGVERVMKQAMYRACQKRAQEKYGNDMVANDSGGQTAVWAIEADKEYKQLMGRHDTGRLWFSGMPKVTLEPEA